MINFFKNKKSKSCNLSAPTEIDGQLVLDVYKKTNEIIVQSTVAGVSPENVEIFFGGNILTVQGSRHRHENIPEENFYHQECYFGSFSRSIKIPEDIEPKKISASLENGILTIKLPLKNSNS
ncbi:MAG: Hsp20/alpha crystallin family protein [Patescibacteria group bacterium]